MTKKGGKAPPVRENPHAPPAAPRQNMVGAVLVGDVAAPVASKPALEFERAATLQENPHTSPSPPRERMAGSVLVDATTEAERAHAFAAGSTLENPHAPPSPPRESMTGSVLVETPRSTVETEPPPADDPRPRTVSAPPSAVRVLPRRPRLRATFHYDHADKLQLELTLMDERRDLIHRSNVQPQEGGALARIFEALVGIAVQAAALAGVFGETRKPPSE